MSLDLTSLANAIAQLDAGLTEANNAPASKLLPLHPVYPSLPHKHPDIARQPNDQFLPRLARYPGDMRGQDDFIPPIHRAGIEKNRNLSISPGTSAEAASIF